MRSRWSSSFKDAEQRTIYDFGQNTAGYVAFTVEGEAGAKVIVEHAEVLDKDGNFYNQNLRSAEARLEYVLKGGGAESYRPHFTFQGFRYARVTITGKAEIAVDRSRSRSPRRLKPGGTFTSGNPLVNRLVENTIWSQRANFIEVPTDCPQRDERFGWTGDAQVFAPTACYLNDSHDILRKWLRDVMADQRAGRRHRRMSSPDPFTQPSRTCAGLLRLDRLGRCHLRRAVGALHALRRPRHPRGSAAGDGPLERFRLVDQQRPDRAPARRTGAGAASPSATGCSRRAISLKPLPDDRRRRGGDDLPLHFLAA